MLMRKRVHLLASFLLDHHYGKNQTVSVRKIMRPTRTKRPPVAADGSLLAVPKKRKYASRKSLDVESNSRSVSLGLEQDGESQDAKTSESGGNVEDDSLSSLSDDSDVEIEGADERPVVEETSVSHALPSIPTFIETPSKQAKKPKQAEPQIPSVNSPLEDLPKDVKETHFRESRARILSVLAGRLPPAGKDERGRFDGSECIGLNEQWRTLQTTIGGTLQGEGNSALLVGAPGTGKRLLLESVLRSFEVDEGRKPFHLVRLDATMQPTDRLSLRELARQLVQAGAIRLPKEGEEGGLNLDLEGDDGIEEIQEEQESFGLVNENGTTEGEIAETENDEAIELQNAILSSLANTTSTILTLLSSDQAKSKSNLPLIIVLSSFDLYTTRPRQALLYVLLDAVQAGSYTPGLCVIGTTSRLDTTDLLEKRVRSRFSGRIINVWANTRWPKMLERVLSLGVSKDENEKVTVFNKALTEEIALIENDKSIAEMLTIWESVGNDSRSLYRAIFPTIASISIDNASIYKALLKKVSTSKHNVRNILDELSTPEFALLIAAKQLLNKDCEIFNFAMCFEEVQKFVAKIERERIGAGTSVVDLRRYESHQQSSPIRKAGITSNHVSIQWAGLSDRKRVMMAFRSLLSLELFQPESILNSLSLSSTNMTSVTAASAAKRAAQTAKTDFTRVKCTIFPQTIVEAAKSKNRVEPLGVQLVQWANSQS